jgi:hypothetical protein
VDGLWTGPRESTPDRGKSWISPFLYPGRARTLGLARRGYEPLAIRSVLALATGKRPRCLHLGGLPGRTTSCLQRVERGTLRETEFLWAFSCVRQSAARDPFRPSMPAPAAPRRHGEPGGSRRVPSRNSGARPRDSALGRGRPVDAIGRIRRAFPNLVDKALPAALACAYCSSCPKGPQTDGASAGGNTGPAPGACSGSGWSTDREAVPSGVSLCPTRYAPPDGDHGPAGEGRAGVTADPRGSRRRGPGPRDRGRLERVPLEPAEARESLGVRARRPPRTRRRRWRRRGRRR